MFSILGSAALIIYHSRRFNVKRKPAIDYIHCRNPRLTHSLPPTPHLLPLGVQNVKQCTAASALFVCTGVGFNCYYNALVFDNVTPGVTWGAHVSLHG